MYRKLLICSALCLWTTSVFATEADFEKRMARGVAALDAGDVKVAQDEFRAAINEHPKDPEAALYLAIALNRGGDPAAESALISALRLDPSSQRLNLELGIFYYNQKMYDEANDYFDNLLTLKPDPEIQAVAEKYIVGIQSHGGGKKWSATILGGVQYDSNVPLAADGVQLPVGIDRRGDWRGVLNLGLNGIALRDANQELSGSYSLYQTVHLHLTDFNLTQNLFDVTYKRKLAPLLSIKAGGSFESILLGGDQFVNAYSLNPGLFTVFQEGTLTGIEYRFRYSSFKDSVTYPTNTERDGLTHSIICNHRQPLAEDIQLRLGYTLERETAAVTAWSSIAHKGNAGIGVTLPYAMLLDISADVAARKYDERIDPVTAVRSDTTMTGAASLTWKKSDQFSASFGYLYTINNSNVAGYEYRRGITSVMFQGRY